MPSNIYLATDGSNGGTGSSIDPFATFTYAISQGVAGDTIIAKDGNYDQQIVVTSFAASSGSKLTIKAENPLGAVIRGVNNTLYIVDINDSQWIVIQDFYIQYKSTHTIPSKKNHHYSVFRGGTSDARITGCTITKLGENPTNAEMLADYNNGYREKGVALRDAVSRIEIDNCTIRGINICIHADGTVSEIETHDNQYHSVQSNIVFNQGSGVNGMHYFHDDEFAYSYMEDAFQTNPDFSAPNGTVVDNLGFLFDNCVFHDHGENFIDTKGGAIVFVENSIFYGAWGSNNGRHTTLGLNSNSANQVTCGANEITNHRVVRNCAFYDSNGGLATWEKDAFYNNVLWFNRRNYTGSDATTDQTKFKAITYTEGTAFSPIIIKNNLIGRSYYGAALRDTGATDIDIDYNGYVNNDNVGYDNGTSTTYASFASWQTYCQGRGWTTEGEANGISNTDAAADIFENVPEKPSGDYTAYNFDIKATSTFYQAGGWITKANGATSSSSTLVVDNSYPFRGTFGRSDVTGETIYIESVGTRVIDSVDWDTHTLTLTVAATVADNAKIYYGDSATPNIGIIAAISGSNPDPPISGGGTSGAVVIYQTAAATSVGTQATSISLSNAPLAVLGVAGNTTANNSAVAHAAMGIGMATSSTADGAVAIGDEDAQGATDTGRRTIDDGYLLVLNPSGAPGTIDGQAAVSSFAADTMTRNWTDAPASATLFSEFLFDCLNADAQTVTIATTQDTSTAVSLAYEADLFFVATTIKPIPDNSANARLSFGVGAWNGTTITQHSLTSRIDDADATSDVVQHLSTSYIAIDPGPTGGVLRGLQISGIDTSGFDLTTKVADWGAATDEAIVLAVDFDGLGVKVGVLTTPTSTGTSAVTGLGFQPAFVGFIGSLLTAIDTGATDSTAGSFAVGGMDGTREYCHVISSEDAAGTTNTQTLSDSKALVVPQHDGTAGIVAVYDSFDADGFTLNYTGVLASGVKVIYWAVEQAATGTEIDLSGSPASLALDVVDPTAQLGAISLDFSGAQADLGLDIVDPTVSVTGNIDLSGAQADLGLNVVDPTVVYGAISLDLSGAPADLGLTTGLGSVFIVPLADLTLRLRRRATVLTVTERT